MSTESLSNRIEAEYQKVKREVQRPNILLAGATGSGKSSLVNLCFGNELANVGVGVPITQTIDSYSHPDVSIVLFDSKGYEVGSQGEKSFLDDVIGLANNRTLPLNKQIHLVWYCIQASGSRITDFDIRAVNVLERSGLPVAIVITKSDLVSDQDAANLKAAIQEAIPNVVVFETSTRTDIGSFDRDPLLNWSSEKLGDALRLGFVAAQKHNIKLKQAEAAKIILQHSGGSALIGFSPIPASDAPILLANQSAMVARILFIYELQKLLGGIAIMPILGPIISELGIFFAGNLLKFIPGIGTAVGGAINATVAGTLTFAFGTAFSELCARIYEQALSGADGKLRILLDGASTFLNEEVVRQLKKRR